MKDFKQLLEISERIFITAHISPDPDAVASVLVLGSAIASSLPNKEIRLSLEEEPVGLDFLDGYEKIQFGPIYEQVQSFKPDLFILLDGNNFERISRNDGVALRGYLRTNEVKTTIIDHHELDGKDDVDVFINTNSPATAQDVYEVCSQLGLKLTKESAQTAMTGFYADTNGFLYAKAGKEAQIFDFAKELVEAGANVELAQNNLDNYSAIDIAVLEKLISNLKHEDDYNFTFLSDAFIDRWADSGRPQQGLQRATHTFLNDFIRNIEHRSWGFLTYKSFSDGDGVYTVSLRSREGNPDVATIAKNLGGGGHKPAAGARFKADSLEDALSKIRTAIVK